MGHCRVALPVGWRRFPLSGFLLLGLLALAACGTPQPPAPPQATIYSASQAGEVYALNASNGKLLWQYRAFSVLARPALVQGTVYTATSGGGVVVAALRARDGAVQWKVNLNPTPTIPEQPVIVNDVLYLVASRFDVGAAVTFLYALRTQDGSVLWQYQTQGYPAGNLAVADGLVYLSLRDTDQAGRMLALDAAAGALRWQVSLDGSPASAPVVAGGLVLTTSSAGAVEALRGESGALAWRYPLAVPPYSSTFVAVGDVVYTGDAGGALLALRVQDGALRWRVHLDNVNVAYMPVLAQGAIYAMPIGGSDPLYAVRASDGTILWRLNSRELSCEGGIAATAVAQAVYCVGSAGGNLAILALSANDGALIHAYTLSTLLYSTHPVVIGPLL
jgi:outer membrane protein assembly factor BamB